ncbi:MAG: group III truncated hemoglobin [Gammaproteobacteria bacterium]|nr:group III truncated hemoglobin [Gammaproteobacteria bacterium]
MTQQTASLAEQIGRDQIRRVINAFYQKLLVHPKLGHFFSSIDDFENHQQRISDFWWMAMGGPLKNRPEPKIDMIGKHFPLGIKQQDLELWLVIFGETLGEQLDEKLAVQWMDKALQIGSRIKQIVIDHQPMGVEIGKPS